MALRDQPYLPLYVQDFLTDEKLNECSALSCGVYIKLMCLMHKSDEYGTILLRQKDKQTPDQIKNFAIKLVKHLPYPIEDIIKALIELTTEGCLKVEGDKLLQKRMIRDNEISVIRKISGSKGGFAKAKKVAKSIANSENEIEYENEIENEVVINDDQAEIIFNSWNAFAEMRGLTKIAKLSDKRLSGIKNRLKEKDFDFNFILQRIDESNFLKGKNKQGWKIDFDFIFLSKHNWIKILEGKYGNNASNDGGATPDELRAIIERRANRERITA